MDLLSTGDGLLTLDNSSHLEWLNLNATANTSYSQTIQSSYYTQLGFKYASFDQLSQLVQDAGSSCGTFTSAGYGTVAQLLADPKVQSIVSFYSLISGKTFDGSAGGGMFYGELADCTPRGDHWQAGETLNISGTPGSFDLQADWYTTADQQPPVSINSLFFGQFLVRDASVPDISNSAFLLGLALLPLVAFRHLLRAKRKLKQGAC